MNSFSILKSRQVGLFAVVGALLLALILPSIVSAAQLTERSIELSSSSKSAPGVTYKVNFTPTTTAGAVLVDFCENSPLIGEECDVPAGFSFTTGGSVARLGSATNTAIVTQAITATATSVTISGITNPSTVGPLYARIITYADADAAATYVADQASNVNRLDEGGAAISITDTIGVSGAVLESMSFCVSGAVIADGCTGTIQAPTLKLGQQVGSAFALVPGVVSEGSIYTQISTNALKGAVVSLKSSTTGCGGLVRAGAANCDIAPALNTGIATNSATAKFGVKTVAATDGTNASGTYQPFSGSIYSPTAFALQYVDANEGVTSPYGSLFLDTAGAPVNNKNMQLTFGATVTNQTPAGLYSADLSLIATGKF
jgi:hypothetical protein